jgi:hypothetical protein
VSDRSKSSKKSNRRPNRAQQQAQQVRLAETNTPAPLDMAVALDQEAIVESSSTAPMQASRRANRRQATQVVSYVLPREVEYGYIRADLRRLIITAGALLALMIALLFILE